VQPPDMKYSRITQVDDS